MSEENIAAGDGGDGQQQQAKTFLAPEEYERRLESQGRDLRIQRQQIRELQTAIESKGAQPQTKAEREAMPNEDEDPIAFIKYAKKRIQEWDANETQAQEQQRVQNEQHNQQAQIARRMEEFEGDFRADHPDYDKAAAHFRTTLGEELQEAGFSGQELNGQLTLNLINIVSRAIRANKDPAKVLYDLAKKRGFGSTSEKDPKLETIAKAQAAGKSLSQGGNRGGDGEVTYEFVNSLPRGKERDDAFKKLRAQERKRA
jgi:hypothetical protein